VVKLAKAGIEERVMLSFIDNLGTFNLGADEIIHLSDLGVSSQVITAMLQHDFDVISGTRPLTITTAPAPESKIQITMVRVGDDSGKAGGQVVTAPAVAASADSETGHRPNGVSVAEVSHAVTNSEPSESLFSVREAPESARPPLFRQRTQATLGKRIHYPVREPYPVELTAPIFLIQAAERPANTIVISMFPETSH
jgi:hypothetical protein